MIQEVRERPVLMRELLGESLRELRTPESDGNDVENI